MAVAARADYAGMPDPNLNKRHATSGTKLTYVYWIRKASTGLPPFGCRRLEFGCAPEISEEPDAPIVRSEE